MRIALSNASLSHASGWLQERSLALRIPASGASSRRVKNRLPGGDANPYLTVAFTLGLGLHGLRAGLGVQPQISQATTAATRASLVS